MRSRSSASAALRTMSAFAQDMRMRSRSWCVPCTTSIPHACTAEKSFSDLTRALTLKSG